MIKRFVAMALSGAAALAFATVFSNSHAASPASAATGPAMGNVARGKQIFGQNCSICHGATGHEGGVGPPLTGERKRKSYTATIAWIKHPMAPMPKLFPSPLNEKAVADVAAFVQTL